MSSNPPLEQNQFEELVASLRHENYRVRYRAVRALGDLGNVRSIKPLLDALGDFDRNDEESKVNRSARNALINIGGAAFVPLIKALAKNTQHPKDGWRRYWVAQTLRFMGDKRAIEPLINVLEDDDLEAIEGAAEALGDLGDKQGIEPLTKTLIRLKLQKEEGYVLRAVSEAIRRLGGEVNIESIGQREQVLQEYEIPQKTKSNIYLHGPWILSSKPTSLEVLELLFGPSEVIAIDNETIVYNTAKKLFINEYRLLSHPWGGLRPKHIEALGFDPSVILGTGITFNWFYYQRYKQYRDLVKIHLEVALSDKLPMVVLIDTALPVKNLPKEINLEEISRLYKPPDESEIKNFARLYGLNDHNIITFDLTERQSLISALDQTVILFEEPNSDPD